MNAVLPRASGVSPTGSFYCASNTVVMFKLGLNQHLDDLMG